MPRRPSCECGSCTRCKNRERNRKRYQQMSAEERKEWVARRDPEKVKAADRARYERDREKRLAASEQYAQTPQGRARVNAAKAAYIERNPEKRSAHLAVQKAKKDGILTVGPCEQAGTECCGPIHAHHDDYAKPLEVRWLCERHHKKHHKTTA